MYVTKKSWLALFSTVQYLTLAETGNKTNRCTVTILFDVMESTIKQEKEMKYVKVEVEEVVSICRRNNFIA